MTRQDLRAFVVVAVAAALPACGLFRDRPPRPPATAGSPAPPPRAEVQPAGEPITVRAWAEPRRLPPAGGQAQIVVLVRRKNGDPLPGVQVRLDADHGSLFSGGRVLVTDEGGRTRDRLTTRRTTSVSVNAGGTVQRLEVAVAAARR